MSRYLSKRGALIRPEGDRGSRPHRRCDGDGCLRCLSCGSLQCGSRRAVGVIVTKRRCRDCEAKR